MQQSQNLQYQNMFTLSFIISFLFSAIIPKWTELSQKMKSKKIDEARKKEKILKDRDEGEEVMG